MERPAWAPRDIDLDRPSAARVYDHFLGGAHNFAVDRHLAEQIAAMTPDIAQTMRANREFLRRAVRFLVAAGIGQFLDIGSGIPTVGNVHEVAQKAEPSARVLYVDIDPVAVSHSRVILQGNDRAAVIQADVREPDGILAHPQVRRLLDVAEPVAVLFAGVLHFVSDEDDPARIVRRFGEAVIPGSYAVISHATADGQPPEVIQAQKLSARTSTEIFLRSRSQILEQFDGFALIDPGLVQLPLWRPDAPGDVGGPPERVGAYGGVGRKVGT